MLHVLLLALTLAQTPPADVPAGRAGRRAVTNGELVNMLDTYAIVQAQDALQLADATYGEFVARLKRLQQIRRRNIQIRNRMIIELRQLTQDGTADEDVFRSRLKALADHDSSAAEQLRQAYASLDEILSPQQQAKFRILEDRLERQKLDLLMRVRNRAAGSAPPRR